MGPGMFDGLFEVVAVIFVVACVSAPFAIWKFIDIGIWIFHHVSVSLK